MFTRFVISIIMICLILVFILSCTKYSTKVQSNETLYQLEGKQIKISSILKKSGEQIQIANPGKCLIKSDTIFILSRGVKRITIDKTNIKQRKINDRGKIINIQTTAGEVIQVLSVFGETKKQIIIDVPPPPSYIPFVEVEKVLVEEYDPDKSVLSRLVWTISILAIFVVVLAIQMGFASMGQY